MDPLVERGRRGPPRPDLRAGRGARWPALVAEPRIAAAGGCRDAAVRARGEGRELVDLTYAGPFDELPAAAGVEHRVMPGTRCRTRRGPASSTSRPGCGQEDFALSKQFGLAVHRSDRRVRRLQDGFGWQTGRFAGAPTTPMAPTSRGTSPTTSSAKGLLVAPRAVPPLTTRSAGAAARSSSSASSTSGSSPWIRCAPSCRRDPRR